MSDERYTLSLDFDGLDELRGAVDTALADLASNGEQLSAKMFDSIVGQQKKHIDNIERLQEKSRLRREEMELASANKIAQMELRARIDADKEAARLLRGQGGRGQIGGDRTAWQTFGVDWQKLTIGENLRVITAEFGKMTFRTRQATIALNAFKSASGFLTGGLVGAGIFILGEAVKSLWKEYRKAGDEADKFARKALKAHKEVADAAILHAINVETSGLFSNLEGFDRMASEAARKGFKGVSGLQRLGEQFGKRLPGMNDLQHRTATMQALIEAEKLSEESAFTFARLWQISRGNLKDMAEIAVRAGREIVPEFERRLSGGAILGAAGTEYTLTPIAGAAEQNAIVRAAREAHADLVGKLTETVYRDTEAAQKSLDAVVEGKTASKRMEQEWDSFVKELEKQEIELIKKATADYQKAFKTYATASQDYIKFVDEQARKKEAEYGISSPADTLFTINKAIGDYAFSVKDLEREVVSRLDKIAEASEKMEAAWSRLQAF